MKKNIVLHLEPEDTAIMCLLFILGQRTIKAEHGIDLLDLIARDANSDHNKNIIKRAKELLEKIDPMLDEMEDPFWKRN